MKLSLALLVGAASAYSSCSNDWYFQEGKSYTYDLTSKLDGQLEFLNSGVPASKGTLFNLRKKKITEIFDRNFEPKF